jgi:hypothetical protein
MRDPIRPLPLALGLVTALLLLVVVSPGTDRVTLVCNNGTTGVELGYEECLAQLPARQAEADESARVSAGVIGPIVAVGGGLLVGISAHLISRRSRADRSGDINER